MDQCNFFDMSLPKFAKTDCTPLLPDEFRGLKINMPSEINVRERGVLPIVGSFRISSKVNNESKGKITQNTVVVFVNKETGDTFSFNLKSPKEPIKQPKPAPFKTPEGSVIAAEYIVNRYFNIDALYFYNDFPEVSAEYIVYATVLDMKSNSIETKIIY